MLTFNSQGFYLPVPAGVGYINGRCSFCITVIFPYFMKVGCFNEFEFCKKPSEFMSAIFIKQITLFNDLNIFSSFVIYNFCVKEVQLEFII